MAWVKNDDRMDDHPKVKKAWRRNRASVGLWEMAKTYSARHESDGLVPLEWIEEKLPDTKERGAVLDVLLTVGLFEGLSARKKRVIEDADGSRIEIGPCDEEGFIVHDYLDYNPSSAQMERTRDWDRRRKELYRDHSLIEAIKTRDKDRCRYCGQQVNWKDRRGHAGGTYDQVIPRGPNSLENVVVACRLCNTRKGGRTPDEAGMPLLEPKSMGQTQSGTSSNLESIQGTTGDDLFTRPDPSRPVPTRPLSINSPPSPPSGGRRRDREKWKREFTAWVQAHPPGLLLEEWRPVQSRLAEASGDFYEPHQMASLHPHSVLDGVWLLGGTTVGTKRLKELGARSGFKQAVGFEWKIIDCKCELARGAMA